MYACVAGGLFVGGSTGSHMLLVFLGRLQRQKRDVSGLFSCCFSNLQEVSC